MFLCFGSFMIYESKVKHNFSYAQAKGREKSGKGGRFLQDKSAFLCLFHVFVVTLWQTRPEAL